MSAAQRAIARLNTIYQNGNRFGDWDKKLTNPNLEALQKLINRHDFTKEKFEKIQKEIYTQKIYKEVELYKES